VSGGEAPEPKQLYRATQLGTTSTLIVMAVAVGVYFIMRLAVAPPWIFWLTLAVLIAVGLSTSSMTVVVTNRAVDWNGTLGLFHQSVDVAKITAVSIVRLPFISGYGLRIGRSSALWRVSGSTAVRLTLTDGRTIFLGSAEPERLVAAINTAQQNRARLFG